MPRERNGDEYWVFKKEHPRAAVPRAVGSQPLSKRSHVVFQGWVGKSRHGGVLRRGKCDEVEGT